MFSYEVEIERILILFDPRETGTASRRAVKHVQLKGLTDLLEAILSRSVSVARGANEITTIPTGTTKTAGYVNANLKLYIQI